MKDQHWIVALYRTPTRWAVALYDAWESEKLGTLMTRMWTRYYDSENKAKMGRVRAVRGLHDRYGPLKIDKFEGYNARWEIREIREVRRVSNRNARNRNRDTDGRAGRQPLAAAGSVPRDG